jgi:NAD-dependent deacetylase
MVDNTERALDEAARLLVESRHVLALVGAGLSAESGVPTFRGPGGLWTKLGEPSMNGYQEFLGDPARWWREQQDQQADPDRTEFREAIERAEPNPGHYALADLERMGILKMTITQNVDDLHARAGQELLAEIHGNRTRLRCIDCESRWPRDRFEGQDYPIHCPECRGLVKSDTVMFGEPIPRDVLDLCFSQTEMCDCMIVCGTSATVYPAASFPQTVRERGGVFIEANPNPTPLSPLANVVLRGQNGQTLPALVERVKALRR